MSVKQMVSDAIKQFMEQQGLKTFRSMSEATGIAESSIGNWANERKQPTPASLLRLYRAGVPIPTDLLPNDQSLNQSIFADDLDSALEDSPTAPTTSTSKPNEVPPTPSEVPLHLVENEVASSEPQLSDVIHDNDPALPINEFFLPVHGFVRLTKDETKIIDHPALQRLGSIKQLGQANLVYRGATHTRLEHVLGTLWVAQRMLDEIAMNHRTSETNGGTSDCRLAQAPTPVERAFIRLAALTHDIGHISAGHTIEDELRLLPRHDSRARLNTVLDRREWPGGTVASLRSLINTAYAAWTEGSPTASDVLLQIIASDPPTAGPELGQLLRLDVCRDIVGNTICADLLDYLVRDWYHIGKLKYLDERILQYMEIRQDPRGRSHFVISLGKRPKIRTDAVSAVLSLLESRYELAESVLFHRTKCAAAAMLERSLQELERSQPRSQREAWRTALERAFLDQSDDGALYHLLSVADATNCDSAVLPLRALIRRDLYRGVSTVFREELTPDTAGKLVQLYTGSGPEGAYMNAGPEAPEADLDSARVAAANRNKAVRLIEEDFGLPQGSVAMYCPDKAMNAKIANVKIYINGVISRLSDWEQEHADMLSGGHLKAQLHRFRRLWRLHVFLDREIYAKQSKDKLSLLRHAVETLIIGRIPSESTIEEEARRLASQASRLKSMPFYGMEMEGRRIGARGGIELGTYPSGAPSLKTLLA